VGLYRLSKEAEQDLEDILGERNSIASDLQIAKILDRFPMLAKFPTMGVLQEQWLKGLRSFPVKPYIVFYILIPDGIEILRIIHQARDIEDYFS
jgi:toxin ParE1/3/4